MSIKFCKFCKFPFDGERDKDYCMADDCVTAGISERRQAMSIMLIPKVNYVPVYIEDVKDQSGRSGGR